MIEWIKSIFAQKSLERNLKFEKPTFKPSSLLDADDFISRPDAPYRPFNYNNSLDNKKEKYKPHNNSDYNSIVSPGVPNPFYDINAGISIDSLPSIDTSSSVDFDGGSFSGGGSGDSY